MKKMNHHPLKFITVYFFALLFCVAAICNAQSTSHQFLLALSKSDHTLAIADPSNYKMLAKVPVGEDPHEVIASADGRTAYVSIYGGGSLHEINVIDLIAQKSLTNIDTRPLWGPHGLTFVEDKVWFTAEGSKAVGRYDPLTNKIDWSMGTGEDRTHMLYVTNNAKKIYTTNVSSGTVSILSDILVTPPFPGAKPHEEWIQTIIPVSKGCEGFDVTPDSSELWAASAEDGKIFIINLQTKKVSATIDAKVNGANRLKFTPDGKLAFITSLSSGNVAVYDVKTQKLFKQINIGNGAAGILMQPDGSRVYVACTPDNYVAVIDLKTFSIIHKIDVGGRPDGLAWAEQ